MSHQEPTPTTTRPLAVSVPSQRPNYAIGSDTYSFVLTGKEKAGVYALIDMHIPPGGGPCRTPTSARRYSSWSRGRSRFLPRRPRCRGGRFGRQHPGLGPARLQELEPGSPRAAPLRGGTGGARAVDRSAG